MAAYCSHPALSLFATPLIVYLEGPIFEVARRDLADKRGIRIDGPMTPFIAGATVSSTLAVLSAMPGTTCILQAPWHSWISCT